MEPSFVHSKTMNCSSSFITLVTLKLRPMTLTNFHMFGHILERDSFLTSRANWSLVGSLMISQLFCFLLWDATIITVVQLFIPMLFLLVFLKSCLWFQGEQNLQIKHSACACSGLLMLINVTPSCLLYTTSGFFDLSLIVIITKSLFNSSCTCILFDLSENVSKRRFITYFFTKYMQLLSACFSSIFIFKLYTCTVYFVWRMGWIWCCYRN